MRLKTLSGKPAVLFTPPCSW